jgi:hypothetical protein
MFWELSSEEEPQTRSRSYSDFAVNYSYVVIDASKDLKDDCSDSEAETVSPKFCWSSESEDDWSSESDDATSECAPESACKFDACATAASQLPPGSWQSTVQPPVWSFAAQQAEEWRFAYALNARKMAMGNTIGELANAAMKAVTRAEKAEKRAVRTRAFKAAAKSGC